MLWSSNCTPAAQAAEVCSYKALMKGTVSWAGAQLCTKPALVAKMTCGTGIWEQLVHNSQVTGAGCATLHPEKSFVAEGKVLNLQTIGFCGLEEIVDSIQVIFK